MTVRSAAVCPKQDIFQLSGNQIFQEKQSGRVYENKPPKEATGPHEHTHDCLKIANLTSMLRRRENLERNGKRFGILDTANVHSSGLNGQSAASHKQFSGLVVSLSALRL